MDLTTTKPGRWPWAAVALIGTSLTLLTAAPFAIPDSFDWLTNTTSESAAQGVPGAWVARLGFVVFAIGVSVIAQHAHWRRAARVVHELFAVGLVATAAFPTRPWLDIPFDRTDDDLHSIAATVVGMSFIAGTALVAITEPTLRRALDAAASTTATTLAILMTALPAIDGLLQRGLFLLAAAWYLAEAVTPRHATVGATEPIAAGTASQHSEGTK